MARALEEVSGVIGYGFQAHPERWHLCRWPDPSELDFCDSDVDARLIIAIRHLGRGLVIYQPVIFEGALPADEKSAAALFALAARNPDPTPRVTQWACFGYDGTARYRIAGAAASSLPEVALHHAC